MDERVWIRGLEQGSGGVDGVYVFGIKRCGKCDVNHGFRSADMNRGMGIR